jgi:2-hydroxy-3-keto-5-methylthiopentenyl-1-phosphate phosphatase
VQRGYEAEYDHYFKLDKILTISSADIKLDSGFKEFYAWCKANDIPVVIVSRYVNGAISDYPIRRLILSTAG